MDEHELWAMVTARVRARLVAGGVPERTLDRAIARHRGLGLSMARDHLDARLSDDKGALGWRTLDQWMQLHCPSENLVRDPRSVAPTDAEREHWRELAREGHRIAYGRVFDVEALHMACRRGFDALAGSETNRLHALLELALRRHGRERCVEPIGETWTRMIEEHPAHAHLLVLACARGWRIARRIRGVFGLQLRRCGLVGRGRTLEVRDGKEKGWPVSNVLEAPADRAEAWGVLCWAESMG